MVDYKSRLTKAMEDARVHPQVLADHLGVSLQSVRKVMGGGSAAFNVQNHFEACRFLRIDPGWLATGEGEMRSGQTWPFANRITPAEFFSLDDATVQAAMDMLEVAVRRQELMQKLGAPPPATDARVGTFIQPAPEHELDSGFGSVEDAVRSVSGSSLPIHHPGKPAKGKGRKAE